MENGDQIKQESINLGKQSLCRGKKSFINISCKTEKAAVAMKQEQGSFNKEHSQSKK